MALPPRFVNAGNRPSVIRLGHSRGDTGHLLSMNSCTRINSNTSMSIAGPILLVLIAGAIDLVTTCSSRGSAALAHLTAAGLGLPFLQLGLPTAVQCVLYYGLAICSFNLQVP
jgi:hypothetical protein